MRRRRQFQAIGDILGKLLSDSKWNLKRQQYALWEQWDSLVGIQIAEQARPLKWSKETLVVGVRGSCWLQELRFKEEAILQKIRATYPDLKINGIRWCLL
ncbi:MAG: DUF721 domain-containing protein [Deltaproteobacteria bacterium]|nr:DUF721 domain-containing protein [Deltaproteobacteria bacterium]